LAGPCLLVERFKQFLWIETWVNAFVVQMVVAIWLKLKPAKYYPATGGSLSGP